MQLIPALLAASLAVSVSAQSLPIPASKGKVTLRAPQKVTGTFDGGLKTYGRGTGCSGGEGGEKDTVFVLAPGATLKNAIIGRDQKEGVYCTGPCTIENVWWEKVCEDALSIKGNGDANIIGGGAYGAQDKVVQHNGWGTVTIDGFTVIDFGKLYRSCGNCKGNKGKRNVVIKNVKAYKGSVLAGINGNFGDSATISGTCANNVKTTCQEFQGTQPGNEPKKLREGPSGQCKHQAKLPTCGAPTAGGRPSGGSPPPAPGGSPPFGGSGSAPTLPKFGGSGNVDFSKIFGQLGKLFG